MTQAHSTPAQGVVVHHAATQLIMCLPIKPAGYCRVLVEWFCGPTSLVQGCADPPAIPDCCVLRPAACEDSWQQVGAAEAARHSRQASGCSGSDPAAAQQCILEAGDQRVCNRGCWSPQWAGRQGPRDQGEVACRIILGLQTAQHGMAVTLQGGCAASTCRETQNVVGPDVQLCGVPNPCGRAVCILYCEHGCERLQWLPHKQQWHLTAASAGFPWLQNLDGAATGSCCSLYAPFPATAGCQWGAPDSKAKRRRCCPHSCGQAGSPKRRACSSSPSRGQQGTLHGQQQSCSCQLWPHSCYSSGTCSCAAALQGRCPEWPALPCCPSDSR